MRSFPAFPAEWSMDRFSERLRQLRSERNITQIRLAELLEVNPRVYNRWETGVATPYWGTIVKIADILNISLDELAERGNFKDSETEMNICNPELHRLYQRVDRLSDEDQKALLVVLDSLLKRSNMRRVMNE